MSTYIMSDIHGNYDKFIKMIEKINFNDNDILYIIGDIFDRGDKPLDILDYIMEHDNIELLLGNHEQMFLDYYKNINDSNYCTSWIQNGGDTTYNKLLEKDYKYISKIFNYLNNIPLYKIINVNNQNFILVHSHIKCPKNYNNYTIDEIMNMQTTKTLLWDRKNILKRQFLNNEYIIIFGHTMIHKIFQTKVENNKITQYTDKIAIDCGAYLEEGKLGCLKLEDFSTYYV